MTLTTKINVRLCLTLDHYNQSGSKHNLELYKMRKDRRLMEIDTKLLENRIKMLEKEESKLLAKISTTRTRANQILDQKQKNDDNFLKRIEEKKR